MPERPAFQQQQRRLSDHIRNPAAHAGPAGVEPRRVGIYRDLFFNNIEGFVRGAFPVLHSILSEEQWQAMVRDFMVHHRCHTPYFLEISEEFIRYLQQTRQPRADDPPFMAELAHYEWVELALDVADEPFPDGVDPNGDLLENLPVVSPVAWPLSYRFPVHRIGVAFQPAEPGDPTYLLVYRNREERVQFMEINGPTARLLALLDTGELPSGRAAIAQVAAEMQHPQPAQLETFAVQTLEQLRALGIVPGTR